MAQEQQKQQQQGTYPESFFCPITHELMRDPVFDPEGNSYERTAIEAWLKNDHSSPITRTPLSVEQLVPNIALRNAIAAKIKDLGGDASQIVNPQVPQQQQQQQQQQPQQNNNNNNVNALERIDLQVKSANFKLGKEILVHASLQPGQGTKRSPADVCCVVDISGSMSTEAEIKSETGDVERHGLSILDVVKHAVRTVVHSLEETDRFALVTFDTRAETVFELTYVTPEAKTKITKAIDDLDTRGSTNLWAGLEKGVQVLTNKDGRLSTLFLLTDGQPTDRPPLGELAALQKLKEKSEADPTIFTFGFGYSIDTPLLVSLADEGRGMCSFIPDASFVGTVFVNSITNILVTMGSKLKFTVKTEDGVVVESNLGKFPAKKTDAGYELLAGSVQYGQSRDVILRLKLPASIHKGDRIARIWANFDSANTLVEPGTLVADVFAVDDEGQDFDDQNARLSFVEAMDETLKLMLKGDEKNAKSQVEEIEKLVAACKQPRAKELLKDIEGQVREATTLKPQNFFQKWGRHYLPSLAHAHLLQQCNNFKDPGVQVYGGQLFQKVRDKLDDVFVSLPPPKPSARPTADPVNMNRYYNAYGGCFTGECLVRMADGCSKRVDEITKGDEVLASLRSGAHARVACVVKTHWTGRKGDLVVLRDGLRITPHHPVRDSNAEWKFPIDIGRLERDVECDVVYNFVMEEKGEKGEEHAVVIEGVECVTLGHGIEGDEVVSHHFFGTQRVIEELKKIRGWNEGVVEVYGGERMVRDKETGLVCGIEHTPVVGERQV